LIERFLNIFRSISEISKFVEVVQGQISHFSGTRVPEKKTVPSPFSNQESNQVGAPKIIAMAPSCDGGNHGADVRTPAELIDAFANHPCCRLANCVVNLLNLPRPTLGYCTTCFATGQFCGSTGGSSASLDSRFNENTLKASFMNVVEATRRPWDSHRATKRDTDEVAKEKKKAARDDLIAYFTAHGKQVNGTWDWSDAYYVIKENFEKEHVCKKAWCAIAGITLDGAEYAQQLVKGGKKAATDRLDDPHAVGVQRVAFPLPLLLSLPLTSRRSSASKMPSRTSTSTSTSFIPTSSRTATSRRSRRTRVRWSVPRTSRTTSSWWPKRSPAPSKSITTPSRTTRCGKPTR